MIYEWHDTVSRNARLSFQMAAQALSFSGGLMSIFRTCAQPPGYRDFTNSLLSSAKAFDELSRDHPTPTFNLRQTKIDGKKVAVTEEIIADKPFGSLIHFKCETGDKARNVPKVLIVAPISGHKATILRDTVRELIPDNDVFIINWKDAREIPVSEGKFDLDEYMSYVQDFIRKTGPQTHVIGISQSTVPVLAVTSLLAALKDPCQPLSMTLMCGPIDPRINETEISRLSRQKDINWFRQNLIARVPENYSGRGRDVFPGFMQAMGMVAAAPGQKRVTPIGMFSKLYRGQGEKIDADAPYYLDTIEQVFLEHRLPRGKMTWKNEKVDPSKIRGTALFTVEGTHDNITAPGQTVIAHDLCRNIEPHLRRHHVQKGAGHYDLFSGKHWESKISNEINDFIRKIAAHHGIAYDPVQATNWVNTPVKTSQVQYAKPALAA